MGKGKLTGQEQVLTTPHPAVKLLNGVTPAAATTLHRDGLSSVQAITSAAGVKIESALYKPFGEQSEWLLPGTPAPETKGWIGERFDADAGLQYLNARYYDPELSLFLQPDWFEVILTGVGTNRFSYSANDPINRLDPNGNQDYKPRPAGANWKNGARSLREHLEIRDTAIRNNVDGDNGTVAAPGRAWGGTSATPKASNNGSIVKPSSGSSSSAPPSANSNTKAVPNPYGRRGGPAHQEAIQKKVQDIMDRGLVPRTEARVKTPEGVKKNRYVDVEAVDSTGKVVERYQVGKQTSSGAPVKREIQAMDDIETADGMRPDFIPYNLLAP